KEHRGIVGRIRGKVRPDETERQMHAGGDYEASKRKRHRPDGSRPQAPTPNADQLALQVLQPHIDIAHGFAGSLEASEPVWGSKKGLLVTCSLVRSRTTTAVGRGPEKGTIRPPRVVSGSHVRSPAGGDGPFERDQGPRRHPPPARRHRCRTPPN